MNAATDGKKLASKMAASKPMTKQQILRKWPSFGSIKRIDAAIDWIEENTTLSNNPFLVVPTAGTYGGTEWLWGFRLTWGVVGLNLAWNVRYLTTRTQTQMKVLDHAINSPVVTMTPAEQRVAKSVLAQMGGTVAFLQAMQYALP